MTERIQDLLNELQSGRHEAARISLPENGEWEYRNKQYSDVMRMALRLKKALEMEKPCLSDRELIAFTRTVPNLPRIFDDAEWEAISAGHYIHEFGNVSNLSPDYGSVISR